MRKIDSKKHRKSIRLKGYDYSEVGAYFVTICTYRGKCLLTDLKYKQIVEKEWYRTAIVRPNIELDEFVVMPNHIHGIIIIAEPSVGAMRCIAQNNRGESPTRPYKGNKGNRSQNWFLRCNYRTIQINYY